MMRTVPRVLSLSIVFLLASCGGGGGGGGGGGNGGQPPVQPPAQPPVAPSPAQSGLVAMCAGSGVVRIDWRLPGSGFDAALFQGASRADVYVGAPVQTGLVGTSTTVDGLTDGQDVFFGLAVRRVGQTAWTPVGSTLRARPAPPIYVDASADPTIGNGLTPQTAFADLRSALLLAGLQNGGNVWVRDGVYPNGPFPLGPNVHCAGGFDSTFELQLRDPASGGTQLTGSIAQEIVQVLGGGADGTLDGLVVDGGGVVLKGVDVVDGDLEVRSTTIRNCADRGLKAVVAVATEARNLWLVGCTITGNVSDGLSTAGPYHLVLDLCAFDANGQEGADIDNLDALDSGTSSLRVTGCRFFGNSFEGLDVDLSAAAGVAANGSGFFDVHVANSSFEVNGLDGLLIDQEYEFFPGFDARIEVVGCYARANAGAGVHVDADANASYRLDRLRCTANGGDGLLITSESNASEVLVSAGWFAGNLGAGVRLANGNKAVLCSQCGFAGNVVGGVVSDSVTCAVANSVFDRQPASRVNTIGVGNFDAASGERVFERAPVAFATILADNAGQLAVASTAGFEVGDAVRVDDAAAAYLVASVAEGSVTLDRAPPAFVAPGMLTGYATADVVDDLRLAIMSPALGVGVAAPGAMAVDAGPFGGAAGGAPGNVDPTEAAHLRLLGSTPAVSAGVTAFLPVVLRFDRDVAAGSLAGQTVVARVGGLEVAAEIVANADAVTVAPPVGGWGGDVQIELREGLAGTDGSELASAVLLPFTLR